MSVQLGRSMSYIFKATWNTWGSIYLTSVLHHNNLHKECISFNTVWKCGNILLISYSQFLKEVLPVYSIFLYEHLSVAMFDSSWLERSSIRLQEAGHLLIITQGAYIKRCRLKLKAATLSMNNYSEFLFLNVKY